MSRRRVPAVCVLAAAAACGEPPPPRAAAAPPPTAEQAEETVAAFRAGAALHPLAPVYCLAVMGPATRRSPLGEGPLRAPPAGVLRAVRAGLAPADVRPLFACRDPGGFPPAIVSINVRWVAPRVPAGDSVAAATVEVLYGAKWHSYDCVLRRGRPGTAWGPGPCTDDGAIIN